MQPDDVVWKLIGDGFCSYKAKIETTILCRHEMNAVGLCKAAYCPLANSRYATVKEKKGICYLYVKTVERAQTPSKQWESIKLSTDYMVALKQIDEHLQYWPDYMIHKCKQRLTRLVQYLIRKRRLKRKSISKLVHVNKKIDRREKRKEYKALVAAKIDKNIEQELLTRLKTGIYDDIYNLNTNILNKIVSTSNEDNINDNNISQSKLEKETITSYDSTQDDIEFIPGSDLESDIDIEDLDHLEQLQLNVEKARKSGQLIRNKIKKN